MQKIATDEHLTSELEVAVVSLSISRCPTPISKGSYNNKVVDWSNCTQPYELDDRAFKIYGKGNKKGQLRSLLSVRDDMDVLFFNHDVIDDDVGDDVLNNMGVV